MYTSIQVFRGVAALLVVLFHVGDTLAKDKYFGAQAAWLKSAVAFGGQGGVAFFFVLSGFIIMHVHRRDLGQPGRLPHYLGRRIVRIYPLYLLVFGAVLAIAWSVPSLRPTVPRDLHDLLAAMLLLPQPPVVAGVNGAYVVTVAWTLQYELVFYAVFALAVVHRGLGLGAVGVYLAHLAVVDRSAMGWLQAFFASDLIVLFILGVLVAQIVHSKPVFRYAGLMGWLGVGVFALVGWMHAVGDPQTWWISADLAYGLISSVVLLGFVLNESSRPDRAHRLPRASQLGQRLGDASYSIYLVHLPIVSLGCKVAKTLTAGGTLGIAASCVLIFVIASGAGWLTWHLIERPMQRWLRKRFEPSPRLRAEPLGIGLPKR